MYEEPKEMRELLNIVVQTVLAKEWVFEPPQEEMMISETRPKVIYMMESKTIEKKKSWSDNSGGPEDI